jgi:hypothetical protein
MDTTYQVRVYLNRETDPQGRPLGMLDGYSPEHRMSLELETTETAPTVSTVCERMFHLLNVGDDPEFGPVDERAVEYRSRRNRSLSIGDVVEVDGCAYACARSGWTAVRRAPREASTR